MCWSLGPSACPPPSITLHQTQPKRVLSADNGFHPISATHGGSRGGTVPKCGGDTGRQTDTWGTPRFWLGQGQLLGCLL